MRQGSRVEHPDFGPGTVDFIIHRVIYAPSLTEPVAVGVEVRGIQVTWDDPLLGTWEHAEGTIEEI